MTKELQGNITTVIAILGFLLGLGNLFWTIRKDRRKLALRVSWKWGTEHKPGSRREDSKIIIVIGTNERPTPISVSEIHFEGTKPDGNRLVIREEGFSPKKLGQSESGRCEWETEEWESIERIFAVDTLRKEWQARPEEVKKVRELMP